MSYRERQNRKANRPLTPRQREKLGLRPIDEPDPLDMTGKQFVTYENIGGQLIPVLNGIVGEGPVNVRPANVE